jgi:hypothetical protein
MEYDGGAKNGREVPAPAIEAHVDHTLAGASARQAAEYVLRHVDPNNEGMHFRKIFEHAVALGWGAGRDKDTIRRTVNSLRSRFDRRGDGYYRLKEEAS